MWVEIDGTVFPASAGVILEFEIDVIQSFSFPRIRGGDPNTENQNITDNGFSPHPRG